MTLRITTADAGRRLDRWLDSRFPHIPFGTRQKLLRTGQIRIDGKRVKPDTRLEEGQEVRLPPILQQPGQESSLILSDAQRQLLDDAVLYSDDSMVALNKPSGLAVQGGSGVRQHLDAWLKAWGGDEDGRTLRLTHRLDRDTSGVLILARGARVAGQMADAFRAHQVEKTYLAYVCGRPAGKQGVFNAPLRKAMAAGGEQMVVDEAGGQAAETAWKLLHHGSGHSWLELSPRQGRTHQLRVHCAALGCPIAGDGKYGEKDGRRLHLHAWKARFEHPKSGHRLTLTAPLPPHMAETWEQTMRKPLPA